MSFPFPSSPTTLPSLLLSVHSAVNRCFPTKPKHTMSHSHARPSCEGRNFTRHTHLDTIHGLTSRMQLKQLEKRTPPKKAEKRQSYTGHVYLL